MRVRARSFRKLLLIAVVTFVGIIGVALAGLYLLKPDLKVGDARVLGFSTYKGSFVDDDKKPAIEFDYGDQIQAGFNYSKVNDSQAEKTQVKFIVKNRANSEVVFQTPLFRLIGHETSMFVSINNTNLPPGDYRVELLDSADKVIKTTTYIIRP